ncbi:MAG TPA: hypothetical protein VK983_02170 [Candidatus Limnocylindrales bacterium]|nr:hypothetical protein [Candidatus Limnocylindrales bacterium]
MAGYEGINDRFPGYNQNESAGELEGIASAESASEPKFTPGDIPYLTASEIEKAGFDDRTIDTVLRSYARDVLGHSIGGPTDEMRRVDAINDERNALLPDWAKRR